MSRREFLLPDHGGEECTDGTLSVGSRHMDHLKFPVRFSKKTKKFPYFKRLLFFLAYPGIASI